MLNEGTNTVKEVLGGRGGILRGIFDVGAVRAGLHAIPQGEYCLSAAIYRGNTCQPRAGI